MLPFSPSENEREQMDSGKGLGVSLRDSSA